LGQEGALHDFRDLCTVLTFAGVLSCLKTEIFYVFKAIDEWLAHCSLWSAPVYNVKMLLTECTLQWLWIIAIGCM